MILEIVAKQAFGSLSGKKFTISVRTDKDGKLHIVTARKIVEWVNEELKRYEAKAEGINFNPDTEAEFAFKKPFRRRE